jgi:hypothetical protein
MRWDRLRNDGRKAFLEFGVLPSEYYLEYELDGMLRCGMFERLNIHTPYMNAAQLNEALRMALRLGYWKENSQILIKSGATPLDALWQENKKTLHPAIRPQDLRRLYNLCTDGDKEKYVKLLHTAEQKGTVCYMDPAATRKNPGLACGIGYVRGFLAEKEVYSPEEVERFLTPHQKTWIQTETAAGLPWKLALSKLLNHKNCFV